MNCIEPLSLPKILFAHVYGVPSYKNRFAPRENYLEITYVAEGELTVTAGGETVTAGKEDVLCFLRREPTEVNAEAPHRHHTVAAAIEWRSTGEEQSALLLPLITPAGLNTAGICRLIDTFAKDKLNYKGSLTACAAKFLELLASVDSCNRKAQSLHLPGEELYTRRAKEYIQRNISTPITQSAVAAHLGISPEYLCSVFRKTEGTTLMRYVNRLKLEGVKALLDNTDLHLYEAAAMYGYNDPNYVSRLYKQIFGYNISRKLPY